MLGYQRISEYIPNICDLSGVKHTDIVMDMLKHHVPNILHYILDYICILYVSNVNILWYPTIIPTIIHTNLAQHGSHIRNLELIFQFMGCWKVWFLKTALTQPFRAPAALGQRLTITFSYFVHIAAFGPFAALSQPFATAAETHIHICRCHSATKSLGWILERLPHTIIMEYT